MPDIARLLAFAACLTLVGSVADAAPKKRRKRSKRQAMVVEAERADTDTMTVRASGPRDWHFAIGPNVWAASVDANVAVGAESVGTAIDFFQLSRNTRYGVPLLAEARYGRVSFVADLMYGVVDVSGANEVGGLMVTLDGTIKSLLLDSIVGYQLLGDNASLVSLDVRGGIRYQRTAISGSVGIDDNAITPKPIVDAGADVLIGARVVARPTPRVAVVGTVDQSVAGSSTATWSVAADASVRVTSRLSLGVGWRKLTQQREALSTVMHGPRAAVLLLF